MATGSVQMRSCSHVGIDVKVPLSKTTGHTTLTFQNYRLENKLFQELGDEMFLVISNSVQSNISPFINFTWKDQHQLDFVTTTVYYLLNIKQGLNS